MSNIHLNLGCSDQLLKGYIGVDSFTPSWATEENFVKADLRHSWPFADGSVTHIRAWDILEHLPDKIHTMNEIHRVLEPEGTIEIVVPTTDGPGAWQDPTHVSYWNRNSFLYHTQGDPHYNRFHEAYGVKGAFRVQSENVERFADGVVKLHITLEAVKPCCPWVGSDDCICESKQPPTVGELDTFPRDQRKRPAFSILHTSARPEEWKKVYYDWLNAAVNPDEVEYILCVDRRWGFPTEKDYGDDINAYYGVRPQDKVIWNTGRRCYVDGVNLAAEHSTGEILIVNADDQYPCERWDAEILLSMRDEEYHGGRNKDFVMEVTTNTPKEHERGILVMPILSRERYERFGWVFFPGYESMYADNDFAAMAKRDNCIIDARHLVFPHKHWLNEQRERDAADDAQNRPEAYAQGEALFRARAAINFSGIPPTIETTQPQRKVVAVCTPGDIFSMGWMHSWTQLALHISGHYNLWHLAAFTSDAGITRTELMNELLSSPHPIDYVLWIDDDNTLSSTQFEMLRGDLDAHPELDAVVGWCWTGPNEQPANGVEAIMSCGALSNIERTEDGDLKYCCGAPMHPQRMIDADSDLIEIGYSGFPVVLMRLELLKKAGKFPFTPIMDDRCRYGKSGEDIAFFAKAAVRSGARFAVDRRVEVPHYKRRATVPTINPFEVKAGTGSQKETVSA